MTRPIPVRAAPHPAPAESASAQATADEAASGLLGLCAEQLRDQLRNLPSWLVSMIVHLILLLVLALMATGGGGDKLVLLNGQFDSSGESLDDALLRAEVSLSNIEPLNQSELLPKDFAPPIDLSAVLPSMSVDVGEMLKQQLAGGKPGVGDGDGESGAASGLKDIKTGIFGLISEGKTFVYVFDRSGSMNSSLQFSSEGTAVYSITPLMAAKTELLKSLRDLGPKQQFHIFFYNHNVLPFSLSRKVSKPIPATPSNVQRAESFIKAVPGEGKTYHFEPLLMALQLKPDVIFLLTDGEEQDDPTEPQLRDIRNFNKNYRTRINVVQIGFGPRPDSSLVRLAAENDGKHLFLRIDQLARPINQMVK